MRIASLLPSATEIVCALELVDHLVAISHDCDYPPEIRGKPILSEAVVAGTQASVVIDQEIRTRVHQGTSVYHLDGDQLARLRPDLILTQELCEVCAPSAGLVRLAARSIGADAQIVSLEPHGLTDILDTILLVGALTGRQAQAGALTEDLRGRIARVRAQPHPDPRPRVVCIEWLEPIFIAGHWVPEMVAAAGGEDVLGRAGAPSVAVEWEEVVRASPDVLVVMPCGFDVARARAEAHLLVERRGWGNLPAVRSDRVYLVDGSAYFNRPGPRVVDGLELLGRILNPDARGAAAPPGAVEPLGATGEAVVQ